MKVPTIQMRNISDRINQDSPRNIKTAEVKIFISVNYSNLEVIQTR